jgi:hypothetical protein
MQYSAGIARPFTYQRRLSKPQVLDVLDKCNWALSHQVKSKARSCTWRDATIGYFIQTQVAPINETRPAIMTTLELTLRVFRGHPDLLW